MKAHRVLTSTNESHIPVLDMKNRHLRGFLVERPDAELFVDEEVVEVSAVDTSLSFSRDEVGFVSCSIRRSEESASLAVVETKD